MLENGFLTGFLKRADFGKACCILESGFPTIFEERFRENSQGSEIDRF